MTPRPLLAKLSDVATIVIALVTLGVLAHRYWPKEVQDPPDLARTLSSSELEEARSAGDHLGAENGAVRFVVFSDYQCPYCKVADASLRRVLAEHPGDLTIVVRHMPLESIHPKALLAASAADCAGRQGRFAPMHEALFDRQDQLPAADATWFAQLAGSVGVVDAGAFQSCLGSDASFARIRTDQQLGTRLGVTGTPAFILDTKLVLGAPDEAGLRALAEKGANGAD